METGLATAQKEDNMRPASAAMIERDSIVSFDRVIEQVALNPDADVGKLEKMMELRERYLAAEAKKSFIKALSDFQMEVPPIVKKKQAHNYKFAPLCDITAMANPILNKHGLSYWFRQSQDEEKITVTCVAAHSDGHQQETSLAGLPDTGGSKNKIQAVGSAVEYLRRYTFTCAFGITTADEDSDGRVLSQFGDFITDEQLAELEQLMEGISVHREKFLKYFKITELKDLPQCRYQKAKQMIVSKKGKK